MKRLILILLGLMFTMPSIAQLQRQKSYFHDPNLSQMFSIDTIDVGGVMYERVFRNGHKSNRLSIENLSNVMTNGDRRLKDGSPLPRPLETYSHGEVYMAGLKRALSETFCNYKTQNEQMGQAGDHIGIFLVFSSETGEVLEVAFSTSASGALQSLPMTIWATLEQKIKEYVYTDLSNAEESKQLAWISTMIMVRFPVEIIGLKANDRISIPAVSLDENLINP